MLQTHYALYTVNEGWKVQLGQRVQELTFSFSSHKHSQWAPTNPRSSSFCWLSKMTTLLVRSVSILHAFKPWSYTCLQSIPNSALSTKHSTHCTHSSPEMPRCVCLHSVISLLTVGMLSVFVSPFSFFMHSTTLRRSSASPANSSMFSPHTLRLAFILYLASLLFLLILLLILVPFWIGSGCFELRHFSS